MGKCLANVENLECVACHIVVRVGGIHNAQQIRPRMVNVGLAKVGTAIAHRDARVHVIEQLSIELEKVDEQNSERRGSGLDCEV